MPELPEVETVRCGLAPVMEGAVIEQLVLRRADLRFPFPDQFAPRLQGQTIVSMGRRAKYLLMDISDGQVVIMHLGMSGSFRVEMDETHIYETHAYETQADEKAEAVGAFHHERNRNTAHDHVVFHLRTALGAKARVIYNDPRRFGFMLMHERAKLDEHPSFVNMGVEPLGNQLNGEELAERLKGKTASLKMALLDQRVVAGLGNIYVCEALWRTGLSPLRQAKSLVLKSGKPAKEAKQLAHHIGAVIEEAIAAGGSTLRDHAQTDGTLGYFQHSFAAYGQEGKPCRKEKCDGEIERIVQSGRSTFYCPTCQK